jgi:hypothetical protein
MRSLVRLLSLFVGVCAAVFTVAALGATSANAYPPGTCPQISASTTTPHKGQHIEVSGSAFGPDESVALFIGGHVTVNGCSVVLSGGIRVGTAHTDATGAFDPQVTVPNLSGSQPLTGVGSAPDDSATLQLTIAGNGPGGTSGGGTATTGVEVVALLVTAGMLLVGGAVLLRAGRRRSRVAA